jgi:threonine aldolase
MNFASDNSSGIAPAILDAIQAANSGYAIGYGADDITRRVEARFNALFEKEVAVFLVATGTAANALAIAHLSPSWGAVFSHEQAHIGNDECGAPEFFGGGLKLIGVEGDACKMTPASLRDALAARSWRVPHSVTPSVLSLSQATEGGTVYTAAETAELAAIAREYKMAVHMDGARFANAVASLGVTPAQATWKAGVDVLSLGATKAGALAAEAIIFFEPEGAAGMALRRKRGGQLVSKHRFIAAQFDAFLADELWLTLARHANRAASRLADALTQAGATPIWPVEANELFVPLSPEADRQLRAAGASYYVWAARGVPESVHIPAGHVLARLVTSFDTSDADVDRFAAIVAASRSTTDLRA